MSKRHQKHQFQFKPCGAKPESHSPELRLAKVMQDSEDALAGARTEEYGTLTEELTDLLYELDEE